MNAVKKQLKNKADLGGAIRHYRKLAGMSQLVLSERCGFGTEGTGNSRVSNYENNLREASTDDLLLICDVLSINVSQLWTQAGLLAGSKAIKDVEPNNQELQRQFNRLPLSQQFLVMEFIRTLLGEPSEAMEKLSSL